MEGGGEKVCDGGGMLGKEAEEKKMSDHHDSKDNNNSWTPGIIIINSSSSSCSSWLLSALADLEERMKALAVNQEGDRGGDTFAQRAESYYRTRPQLLLLLQDLYKSFVYLSERYAQVMSKQNNLNRHHSRRSSLVSATTDNNSCPSDKEDDGCISNVDFSDAESSLSYQHPKGINGTWLSSDGIIAELVIKNVEKDIILHELELAERRCNDSSRKISLQRSLLEVLESERMILLHENGRLGHRVSALVDENRDLTSESVYVKRMAGELARCMIKMREEQRVSLLSRRIEDLQGQVRGLEKRNTECYERLTGRDVEVTLADCLQLGKLKTKGGRDGASKRSFNWWERVKRMDIFMCGMQTDIS